MKPPSYSEPAASWRDGAHRSAMPWVPTAKEISGRSPGPVQGTSGVSRVPVTALLRPCASRLTYMIRWASAGAGTALSGSRKNVLGSALSTRPGFPRRSTGGV